MVVMLVLQARQSNTQEARHRSLAIATAFADAPGTVAAMTGPDPTAALQPRVEELARETGVDIVLVASPEGLRQAHSDPSQIGTRVPFIPPAPEKADTATIQTPAGLSVTSVAPVTQTDGRVVGVVGVGITVENVIAGANRQLPLILGIAAGALALAAGSAVLASRWLRRQTRGLGPAEMTRMYEHHDAVLHSVREGVLVVGDDGRLLLANDESRRLLDLPLDAEGRPVSDRGLEPGLADLRASGTGLVDEVHPAGERLLAVSVRPTDRAEGAAGSVATLRDTTELRALAGRAEVARTRLRLLYDAGVRIGTTLDVRRTAEELAEVTVPRFADYVTVDLADAALEGEETRPGEGEMLRTVVHGIRDGVPFQPVGTPTPWEATEAVSGSARAVLEADLSAAPRRWLRDPGRGEELLDHGIHSLITVPLRARNTVLGVAEFWRSRTTEPFEEDDLSSAEELAARAATCIDNARRYTREHTMAATLQRSLLPSALPEQNALEIAYRYLPAQAEVGGDWFDVIPLSGARVALVVGDVVGHGVHAAATMGRLRTAVHTYSTMDLPPDELLARLDDLVGRIAQDESTEKTGTWVTGSTCLYAIYDPVSGTLTVARAGHPPPVAVTPDGTATFPDTPVGPPLGLGIWPFEAAELRLPAGSRLVLYTNGLVVEPDRDLGVGLETLRETLARTDRSAEQTCQAALDALRPSRARDDTVLLVARTRLLGADRVVDWDVPRDRAAVPRIRSEATRQLEASGLEEMVFTTELILSELVTNAIRYGSTPIRVRLLYDRTLICEVSDGSSTSPHLRYAATTDEGGRGLFLVAQLADRWGTRYPATGKIIWAEQTPRSGPPPEDASEDDLLDRWADPAM